MTKIQRDVALKDFSNYKIGGNASYFLNAATKEDLLEGLKEWKETSKNLSEEKRKIFLLGGGTNVLFPDSGFDGLVIKNSINGIALDGDKVTVGAGTLFTNLVDYCVNNSLSGLQWAGGMPGTVGGAVRGNAGAFGGETKDNVLQVYSINLESLGEITRNREECEFSYRNSIFKKETSSNEVIVSVVFTLLKGIQQEIKEQVVKEVEFRQVRHPLESPNLGSIFKNVPFDLIPQIYKQELLQYVKNDPFPVVPTAKIIYLTGLKGRKVGDAMVSEKHTNFIVNLGNATAKDVSDLIAIIKIDVQHKFGVSLEEEIMRLDQ
jgi:UDP-N-acetylmuramate dehydrogenase